MEMHVEAAVRSGLFCVFSLPGAFLRSRVTGACPVTTNLIIMRVNLRTTSVVRICYTGTCTRLHLLDKLLDKLYLVPDSNTGGRAVRRACPCPDSHR